MKGGVRIDRQLKYDLPVIAVQVRDKLGHARCAREERGLSAATSPRTCFTSRGERIAEMLRAPLIKRAMRRESEDGACSSCAGCMGWRSVLQDESDAARLYGGSASP